MGNCLTLVLEGCQYHQNIQVSLSLPFPAFTLHPHHIAFLSNGKGSSILDLGSVS